jgi:anti-anti-sigma factor
VASSGIPYRFEKADGYAVISLQPELNNAQWADIEKIGTDLLNQLNTVRSRAMIVDLSSLNYMGSAMVALVVRLWKSVKEDNGRMVVVNRDPNVFEVLKLAGLHKVWTVVETREQSVKALGKRPAAAAGGGSRTALVVGIIALLAVVAGVAFWLGRMGRDSSAAPPAVEEPADEAAEPAEDANTDADDKEAGALIDGRSVRGLVQRPSTDRSWHSVIDPSSCVLKC